MFTEFARDYYGLDPLTVGNFVDIITYKEVFPIFYFDVSKQSESVSHNVVDIKIRMRFAIRLWYQTLPKDEEINLISSLLNLREIKSMNIDMN